MSVSRRLSHNSKSRCVVKAGCVFLCLFIALSIPRNDYGQELITSRTDGHTPSALTAGSPVGSYPLADFESVNPYSGALNFHFPLLRIGGRGSAGYTMMLPIENKWKVEHHVWPPPNPSCSQCPWQNEQTNPVDFYMPTLSTIQAYGAGELVWRGSGEGYTNCSPFTSVYYQTTLTRFTFIAPDGTQIEFRDAATGGQPRPNPMGSACQSGEGFNRGKIFFAGDGSAATFISATDIKDNVLAEDGPGFPTGHILFADGSAYHVVNGVVVSIRDRNGNKVAGTTDSLGRQVTVTPTDYQTILFDQIAYKGFGGASRTIKVWYGTLHEILRVTQSTDSTTIKTYQQLFPGLTLPPLSNPDFDRSWMVRRLELPDGRNYRFFYNVYGELARVELPTGGAIEYDYDGGLAAGTSGLVNMADPGIYRRVIERRVYIDATNLNSLESKTTFSRPQFTSLTNYDDFVDVTTFDAAGTVLSRVRHFYHSHAAASLFLHHFPNDYTDWREGKEYKTEFYDANNNLLKRVENLWEQTPATAAENNPHITRTTTTLADVSPNLVAKQEFTYDQYNNKTNVYEYDFGSGAPGPLVRRTRTDYVTATAYTDAVTGAHLRRLPTQVSVFDAGGIERARTTFEYDNYTGGPPNHADLLPRGDISGFDAAFSTSYTTRGNITATTSYLLTNGAITGSITAYNHYDIAGNIIKSIDARGFATNFEFLDRFGASDHEAQSNTIPQELLSSGQVSYAFATKITNAANHTAFIQHDYYLGAPVNSEEPNGIVSSSYFNDSLDRPTQVRRAVGTLAENQTTFSYDDVSRIIISTSDLNSYNDNLLKSQTIYDGLGRTIETRQYEGGANYIAVKQIPFIRQQDPDNSAWLRSTQSSNPYRPYLGEQPVWTTTFFDALDRIVKVRTPDNAIVRTSYSGNTVTVTDQDQPTGKRRKSVTDALGRLKEVWEDPGQPPAQLNYQTSYEYDVLDNLISVSQGTQQRFFMYDSLKRLIRVRNPEQAVNGSLSLSDPITGNSQWGMAYEYDNNGNLTQKTDARGVISVYVYDALNRNTTVDYSDTATINPDITRVYDTAANGKGRLRESYKGGNETIGTDAEHTKIESYDALGRPLDQRQRFKTINGWSAEYKTLREYNRAGGVISQTYPSGHITNYTYDNTGRINSFTGNLGDGVVRTYATAITYSTFGGTQQEQFGIQTPLFHKLHYNVRGQLNDIRLSTVSWQTDQWNWNRGAHINYYSLSEVSCQTNECRANSGPGNNGNIIQSQHWVPANDQISSYNWTEDRYTYDSLNRITSIAEYHGWLGGFSAQDFTQIYNYDRWGNRTINSATTDGMPETQFSVLPNNRLSVPVGQTGRMDYDAAGNLVNDTYTSYGRTDGTPTRLYDGENHLTTVKDANLQVVSSYSYNAEGQRTRRTVNGVETWQIYGLDGELLGEYKSGAAPFLPSREYGYRGGQLLVTMSSGDDARLTRFVYNLYYGALQRDPTSQELQDKINQLAAAGVQGQSQLVITAKQIARSLFISTAFETSPYRSDTQYVTDLYYTYLQRGPDSGGLGWWVSQVPGSGRENVLNAFEASSEFSTIVSTLYGVATSDNQRTENFVNNFYLAALGRHATSTELQQQRDALNTAAAQGLVQVQAEAESFGRSLFLAQINDASISNTQYVTNLYEGFLQRGPDAGGLGWWSGQATLGQGRQNVLDAFAVCIPFRELAGTLYREALWLVADHLGTPRMIVSKSGGLGGIKRHDYLPFGEEIAADAGGRTPVQGYVQDTIRQKFTSKERDFETGLDYFLARYYYSTQGRFTSPDEFKGGPGELYVLGKGDDTKQALPYAEITNPQSLNKYTYCYNNSLRYIDPDGHKVQFLRGQTEEQRREARGRLMFNLAPNERKYFTIKYDKKTKEYTLALKGNVDKALSKSHTQGFTYMVQTVRHADTVQVGISETFQFKQGPVTLTDTTANAGGGATIPKANSMSGDVEVHLSRSDFVPSVPGLSGHPVNVSRSIIAGHEVLGHARQLMVTGTSSEPDAIRVENELRTGRGLPLRQP